MSILVGNTTVLLVQGITGRQGQIHTARIRKAGTHIAAGVSPGRGGTSVEGVPVYNTVAEAVDAHPDINATILLTPPRVTLASAYEAIDAGIPLVVVITEYVPVLDSLRLIDAARRRGIQVVGPNTIGVISPGRGQVGVMPAYIYSPGRIGVISRSGTLTHEMASNLTFKGYGQSTCVGIGGDPVIGLTHAEAIEQFAGDGGTDLLVLIGEIGGTGEETAAAKIKSIGLTKPVVAYIAGQSAPVGAKMGHAGAIVSGSGGTAASKMDALRDAGVTVCETLGLVVDFVAKQDLQMGGRLRTGQPIADEATT